MRRRALAAAAGLSLAAGCNPPVQGDGDGALRFQVGALEFRPVSGAAVVREGGLGLWLSDHPDTCAAIAYVPAGQVTALELRVAPRAGGEARATVVARKAEPLAGEAVGGILRSAAGTPQLGYDASDGEVAWTAHLDGAVTLDAIDVGFEGAEGRVVAAGLHLAACDP